jgi:hypothetical protein
MHMLLTLADSRWLFDACLCCLKCTVTGSKELAKSTVGLFEARYIVIQEGLPTGCNLMSVCLYN